MTARGRPSKLTPEVQRRIVRAIKLGATHAIAAARGGIDISTMMRWMAAGECDGARQYREFRAAVKAAEGEAAETALKRVNAAAAKGTWQAAAWLLERRYREGYALHTTIAGDAAAPLRFTFAIGEPNAGGD